MAYQRPNNRIITPRQRVNGEIIAPELRVIDEKGENLGVMKREDAFTRAKSVGLDIIEIAPDAKPPVAKIISFDKWRYQQEKEEKKASRAQKQKELKQVRISPRIAQNDLIIKARQAEKFLAEGHKVEIDLHLRGREKANKEWALKKIREFAQMINVPYQTTMEPKQGGRGYVMQITRK